MFLSITVVTLPVVHHYFNHGFSWLKSNNVPEYYCSYTTSGPPLLQSWLFFMTLDILLHEMSLCSVQYSLIATRTTGIINDEGNMIYFSRRWETMSRRFSSLSFTLFSQYVICSWGGTGGWGDSKFCTLHTQPTVRIKVHVHQSGSPIYRIIICYPCDQASLHSNQLYLPTSCTQTLQMLLTPPTPLPGFQCIITWYGGFP